MESINLHVYGQNLSVDRSQQLYVNNIQQTKPFFYPNENNWNINVRADFWNTYLETDFHMLIQYRYCDMQLTMPVIAETNGSTTLCGLSGNIDNECKNDLLNR